MNLFDKITGINSRVIPGRNTTDTFGSASNFFGGTQKSILPQAYTQQAPTQFGMPTQPSIQPPQIQQEDPITAQFRAKGYDDKDIEFLKQAKAKGYTSQQAFSYLDKKKQEQKQGPGLGIMGSIGQAGVGAFRTGEQIPRYAGNLLDLTQKYITTPLMAGGAELLGQDELAGKIRTAGAKFGAGAKGLGEEITRAGEGDITEKQREARRFGASVVATAPIPLGTASKALQGAGLAKTAVRGAIAGGVGTPIYTGLEEGRLPTAPEMTAGTVGGAILGPVIEKGIVPALGKGVESLQRWVNPVKFTKQMDDETTKLIRQAVRPSISGVDTAGKFEVQDKKLLQGVKEIIGQGKKPTNSRELMTAIKETKEALWNKVKEANASVTAETSGDDIALKLRQFINDPENRPTFLSRPELKGNLMKMADEIQSNPDFKNITQDELQQVLSDVNSRIPASSFLKQLDANPTQTAQNTIIAKVYKEILDDNLEKAVGVAGNEARQAYGAVRQLEKDFAKRFGVYLRQNPKGLADMFGMEGFADVAVGLLSGNPAQFARGALIQGAKNLLKKSNSPDTIINDIFSLQNKIKKPKIAPVKKSFTGKKIVPSGKEFPKTKAEKILEENKNITKRAKEIKYLKEDIASNTKAARYGGTGNTRIESGIESAILQKKITRDEAKDILLDIFDDVNSGSSKYSYIDKKQLEKYIEDFWNGKKIEDFDELVTPKKITPTPEKTVKPQKVETNITRNEAIEKGFSDSAKARWDKGEFTQKERGEATTYLKSNYKGKEYTIDGKKYKVDAIDNRNEQVRLVDSEGNILRVKTNKLPETKVSPSDIQDYYNARVQKGYKTIKDPTKTTVNLSQSKGGFIRLPFTSKLNVKPQPKQLFAGENAKAPPKGKTGWFKGADGKMRFEIDDSVAKIQKSEIKQSEMPAYGQYQTKLKDVLDHQELFKQYPELKEMDVYFDGDLPNNGFYSDGRGLGKKGITLKADFVQGKEIPGSKGWKNEEGTYKLHSEAKSTILHELQHAIQEKEIFAKGGNLSTVSGLGKSEQNQIALVEREIRDAIKKKNSGDWVFESSTLDEIINSGNAPSEIKEWAKSVVISGEKGIDEFLDSTPFAQYQKLAGEVEARNVQSRMNLTAKERTIKKPESTEDVPRPKQIIRMDSKGPSMSIKGDGIKVYKGVNGEGNGKKFPLDYFTTDKKSASQYGKEVIETTIYPKKIADFTNPSNKAELRKILRDNLDPRVADEFIDRAMEGKDSFSNPLYEMVENPKVTQALKDAGYDSTKYLDYGNKNSKFARHETIAMLDVKPISKPKSIKGDEALMSEARKYGSADDFIDYIENNKDLHPVGIKPIIYRGEGKNYSDNFMKLSDSKINAMSDSSKDAISFATSRTKAKEYGDVSTYIVDKNAKIANLIQVSEIAIKNKIKGNYSKALVDKLKELGYDGYYHGNQEVVIINPKSVIDIKKLSNKFK